MKVRLVILAETDEEFIELLTTQLNGNIEPSTSITIRDNG